MQRTLLAAVALMLIGWVSACVEETPERLLEGAAPDFALVDHNPASQTYLQTRTLSEHTGVVVLFFASYT